VDATNTLVCAVVGVNSSGTGVAPTSQPQPLISNVKEMTAVYGLDVDGDGNIDRYKLTKQMTNPTDWDLVKNVKVTLKFINPNDTTKTIAWTQVINVMNNK
jgi:hypothetical protein